MNELEKVLPEDFYVYDEEEEEESETEEIISNNRILEKSQAIGSESANFERFPGTARTSLRNEINLAKVLEGKTDSEKVEILRIMHDADIGAEDPLYAVLLVTGQLERLLVEYPERIKQIYKDWSNDHETDLYKTSFLLKEERDRLREIIDKQGKQLEAQSQAAITLHKNNIQNVANQLVTHAAFTKVAASLYSVIIAGGVLVGVLGLGAIGGYLAASYDSEPIAPEEPRVLKVSEAIALEWSKSEVGQFAQSNPELVNWARSSEGKYAKKLMEWNRTLLAREKGQIAFKKKRLCQKDTEKLGVVLSLEGRVVKNGFCTLWIVPPEQREIIQ